MRDQDFYREEYQRNKIRFSNHVWFGLLKRCTVSIELAFVYSCNVIFIV
jgi:hypothetical protein